MSIATFRLHIVSLHQAMKSTAYVKPYKARCSSVIGCFFKLTLFIVIINDIDITFTIRTKSTYNHSCWTPIAVIGWHSTAVIGCVLILSVPSAVRFFAAFLLLCFLVVVIKIIKLAMFQFKINRNILYTRDKPFRAKTMSIVRCKTDPRASQSVECRHVHSFWNLPASRWNSCMR